MASINMKSILAKAKAHTNTSAFQQKVEQKIDGVFLGSGSGSISASSSLLPPDEAAKKFIEVLKNQIESLGASNGYKDGKLGPTAISALTNLSHGDAIKIGKKQYQIQVWFEGDLHRDSLVTDEYDGIDNIAALLNNGYSAGNTVYGVWLNHYGNMNIPSLRVRAGARFIDSAVREFMTNYAAAYGVVDIKVDEIYK